jgi:hypothetical protein
MPQVLTMTIEKTKRARLLLSIPQADKFWLQQLADDNCTSANAEIVRAIRERREHIASEQARAAS